MKIAIHNLAGSFSDLWIKYCDENKGNEPKIVEISYCFPVEVYDNCPGYWDSNLNWHEKIINPQYFMIEDFIESISRPKLSNSHFLNISPVLSPFIKKYR